MADNDLADLNTKLATALRDADGDVWATGERDDLLTWGAAQCWPRLAARVREAVALVDDQSEYTLTTVQEISRVDLLDGDDNLLRPLAPGSWEFWGDGDSLGGTLFINRAYADSDRSLRVHGYAPYNLTTELPSERIAPLILARAVSEALRRAVYDRAKFEQWRGANQTQNVSMNELTQMLNDSERRVEMLERSLKTWRKPVPARV